jgi:hypothetical protein
MNLWSVEGIQKIVTNLIFLAHRHHWSGLPRGRPQVSFGTRAASFFPPKDTRFNSASFWGRFIHRGYLKDYHTYMSSDAHTEEDKEQFNKCLFKAFDLLDCLPNRDVSIKSQPWHFDTDTQGPTFLVNAKTYRIKGVGNTSQRKKHQTQQKLMAGGVNIDILLLAETENLSIDLAQKQIKRQQRGTKKQKKTKRVKRRPPLNKA